MAQNVLTYTRVYVILYSQGRKTPHRGGNYGQFVKTVKAC